MRKRTHGILNRQFLICALAQGLSILGSQVVAFVLGIYVVQQGDGTKYWTMILFSGYVAAAIAGFGIARSLDRRNLGVVLFASNVLALVVSLVLLVAVMQGFLSPYLLVGTNFVAGLCNGIVQPSFSALIPRMVPEQHVDRAQGAAFAIMAAANVSAPGVGAVFYQAGGVSAAFVFDVCSCISPIVAVVSLRLVKIGRPLASAAVGSRPGGRLPRNRHVTNMLTLFVLLNLLLGTRQVLRAPQVLNSVSGSPEIYSVVQMATGIGTVMGGLVLAKRGAGTGSSRQLGFIAICMGAGGQMLSAVDAPWAWVLGAAVISFLWPYLGSMVLHTIVATTAPDQRARTISFAYAAQATALPVAVLVGGFAADALQGSIWVQSLFGAGPAGTRAVLVITGATAVVFGLVWLGYRPGGQGGSHSAPYRE